MFGLLVTSEYFLLRVTSQQPQRSIGQQTPVAANSAVPQYQAAPSSKATVPQLSGLARLLQASEWASLSCSGICYNRIRTWLVLLQIGCTLQDLVSSVLTLAPAAATMREDCEWRWRGPILLPREGRAGDVTILAIRRVAAGRQDTSALGVHRSGGTRTWRPVRLAAMSRRPGTCEKSIEDSARRNCQG